MAVKTGLFVMVKCLCVGAVAHLLWRQYTRRHPGMTLHLQQNLNNSCFFSEGLLFIFFSTISPGPLSPCVLARAIGLSAFCSTMASGRQDSAARVLL